MKRYLMLSVVIPMFYLNVGGCLIDDSVDDFTFQLPQKQFSVDTDAFTPPTTTDIPCQPSPDTCTAISADLACGTGGYCEVSDTSKVPTIPCTAADDPCASLGDQFSCNLAEGVCQVLIPFELVTVTDLANEVPELQTVGQYNFTTVRLEYIRMRVMENTFSVATPPVDIYVAPDTVATLYVPDTNPRELAAGVQKVGQVPSIPAGVSGHEEDVQLSPGGSAAITEYCREPDVPFHMFVYSEILLKGGDPIPQGRLTLQVDSAATVGLN